MVSVAAFKHIDSAERYIESVKQGLYHWKYHWKVLLRVISYTLFFSFWCSSTDQILVGRWGYEMERIGRAASHKAEQMGAKRANYRMSIS